MIVYVVTVGERGEGSRIVAIFSNKKDAIECALKQEAHYDDPQKKWYKSSVDSSRWYNGLDVLEVRAWTVVE